MQLELENATEEEPDVNCNVAVFSSGGGNMTFSQLIVFAISQGVNEPALFGLASPPPPAPATNTEET